MCHGLLSDSGHMETRDLIPRRFHTLVLMGALPVGIAAMGTVVLGTGNLITLAGESRAMMHELEAGTLTVGALEAYATHFHDVVWGVIAITVAALPLTLGGLVYALRSVGQRLDRAGEYIMQRANGLPAAPLDDPSGCSVGRLEEKLMTVAEHLEERQIAFEHEVASNRFDAELQRALDLIDREHEVFDVATRALVQALPGQKAELLMADSSNAHLRRVLHTPDLDAVGCAVASPRECAAVRRGRTLTFASSEALDACPKLRSRECGPCSAVCSPVTVMGKTIGVLHTIGPDQQPLHDDHIRFLPSIAAHVGARLGMIRTLADSQAAARTDGLTGLLNRRSFEDEASIVLQNISRGLLVMADIDHFKRLNDTYGHQVGDRAIQLFSKTITEGLRDKDVIGRYGGEEFIVVLPEIDVETGVRVLQRLRDDLADRLANSNIPAFTCSMGVAQFPVDGHELAELTKLADGALYTAKRNGRDRIEVVGRVARDVAQTVKEDKTGSLEHIYAMEASEQVA